MGIFKSTTLITAPPIEPVSLTEIKTHLHIDTTDHDTELTDMIKEGRQYVEQHTGRALIGQTWDLYLDDFNDEIRIPYPPLQSITSVKYQDLDNAEQTLSSSNYTVDTKAEPGRLYQSYGGTYPSVYPDLNSVVIRFVAGYNDATDSPVDPDDVPEKYKRAIKLYVQWAFDQDQDAKSVLDHLINQDKINWFGLEI